MKMAKHFGGAGYRSRYLSHAKRALYHLSYAPVGDKQVFLTVLELNVCQGRLLRIVKVTELDQAVVQWEKIRTCTLVK